MTGVQTCALPISTSPRRLAEKQPSPACSNNHIHIAMLDLDKIATEILDNLRDNATRIVSTRSLSSPRAIGDAVQSFIAEESLPAALAKLSISSTDDFSRRAMEDVAFTDADGNYYAVDVKTHNTATSFNMPNLISVKRLATFYRNDDRNNFCILIVEYHVDGHI